MTSGFMPAVERKKIRQCLLDFASFIGIGYEYRSAGAMFEEASLENIRFRFLDGGNFLPFRAFLEESPNAESGALVKISACIFAVSQDGRDRNDPLVLIVGKRHENVNSARLGLRERRTKWQGKGSGRTNDSSQPCHSFDSSNSFIQFRFFKTSRGFVPSGGPTMPSFSMRSIKRAARP
jgi:hypothetical protein